MLFSDSYYSIALASEAQFRDKGSKFLGFAFPVKTEREIKEKLSTLKKEHPSANHHCYAWRLGSDKSAFRTNDDGEPTGTAGKPIFSQIQSNDLSNILIVVVRYFGGTLLGVSGLIHAYKTCAILALSNTSIVEQFIIEEYRINFTVDDISAVMRLLKENEAKILENTYTETNTILFRVKRQKSLVIEKAMQQLYKAQLTYIQTV